jgi:hypothetical protein
MGFIIGIMFGIIIGFIGIPIWLFGIGIAFVMVQASYGPAGSAQDLDGKAHCFHPSARMVFSPAG